MAAAQASAQDAGSRPAAAAEIQNLVSDGNADSGPGCPRKHAEGQVLDGECAGAIGRGYPAPALWIVRIIHGYIYGMGRPVKCFLSACHT